MPPGLKRLLPFSTGSSVVKALIEAAVIGGILMFGNIQVLGSRLTGIKGQITQVQRQLNQFDHRLRVVEKLSVVNAQRITDKHPRG